MLDRELDISRGDLIVAAPEPATVAKTVHASLVWMDQRPLELNRRYLLKHTSHTVPAFISAIQHRTDISTLTHEPAETFEMNDIGVVTLNLLRPIALDPTRENRSTGAFILIDPRDQQHRRRRHDHVRRLPTPPTAKTNSPAKSGPVTARERAARWGHQGGALALTARRN